ncbi:MAG: HDOD domain-containing protein [Fimbriimonadaceae bacterium]|nr:HDOD domain-containing protein [Fimbriimonadaceae bacterium]
MIDQGAFHAKGPKLDSLRIMIRRKDQTSPMQAIIVQALTAIAAGEPPRDVAEVVGKDPSLSLKVVRVASSAAFYAKPVQSIRHAIDLLGPLQVGSILASLQMVSNSDSLSKVQGMDQQGFRLRSLLTAGTARTIARKIGTVDPDLAHITGLLLDCGYLCMAGFFPREMSMVALSASQAPNEDVRGIEKYYLGFDHTEVGELMTGEHGLAQAICEASRWHHEPIFASEPNRALVDIVHLADWIAAKLGYTTFPNSAIPKLDDYACKRLGIQPADLESMFGPLMTEAMQHDSAMGDLAA